MRQKDRKTITIVKSVFTVYIFPPDCGKIPVSPGIGIKISITVIFYAAGIIKTRRPGNSLGDEPMIDKILLKGLNHFPVARPVSTTFINILCNAAPAKSPLRVQVNPAGKGKIPYLQLNRYNCGAYGYIRPIDTRPCIPRDLNSKPEGLILTCRKGNTVIIIKRPERIRPVA